MTSSHTKVGPAPGTAIPVSADFPVSWEDPEDARKLWRLDPIHYPSPIPALEHDLLQGWLVSGTERALASYNLPIRYSLRNINGYLYNSVSPENDRPEFVPRLMYHFKHFAPGLVKRMEDKAVAGMAKKYLEPVEVRLNDLRAYWEEELLPEIMEILRHWRDFNLEGASWPELLEHLEWTLEANERGGCLHSLISVPFLLGWSEFDELYKELFPHAGPFDSHQLTQGFDNQFLKGDRRLWNLGRKALTMPVVQEILERKAAADVVLALHKTAAGQVFLTELDQFISEHGHRNTFVHYSAPGWQEDPTPVIKMLKDYITQPDRDMDAELSAEGIERERRVAEARASLQSYPQPVRDRFEFLLAAAQAAEVIHNDHAYWLDCAFVYEVRRVMLAFGRRFVSAGIIDNPDDIMHLRLAELERIGAGLAEGQAQDGRHTIVSARQGEMTRFAKIKPPPQLGTVPWLEPPDNEPMLRAGQKFTGASIGGAIDGSQEGSVNGEVRGNAGSPGIARGIARVVRSLGEVGKLVPGDILVTETTAPPWTPFFATVAAVVTDTGGILSHSAVVAREYRIPAVVGTGSATETLRDGQLIEVDGNVGIVRILIDETEHEPALVG